MEKAKKRIVKNKVFQDATQGYIEIDSVYVKYLIDTLYLQREKNVSQVGIRSVYSGATHDRFSHSLGVYGMGIKLYNSLKKSLLNELDSNIFFDDKDRTEVVQMLKCKIDNEYEILYSIACLLHDIGHPAFSHTLEYLYEDDFINLGFELSDFESSISLQGLIESFGDSRRSIEINEEEVARIIKRYNWILKEKDDIFSSAANKHKNYLIQTFEKALNKAEGGKNYGGEMHASPHEIMGAYQILASSDIRENIRCILDEKEVEINLDDACAFIARMITGKKYDVYSVVASDRDKQEQLKIEYSLKNCIIMLLNGAIDADSLDYLNRNSHFSGYATNNLDITRLCNAFQISFDDKRCIFDLCIYKSALSSLDDFIQARNFEPRWLYSHHKIVYFNEVLIEYLMKMSSAYMYEDMRKQLEELLLECLFGSSLLYDSLEFQLTKGNLNWNSYYDEFKKQDKAYTEEYYWEKHNNLCECYIRACIAEGQTEDEISNNDKNKAILSQQKKPLNLKFSILNFTCFVEEKLIEVFNDNSVKSEKKLKMFIEYNGFVQYADDIVRRLKYIYIHYILSPILSFKQGKNNLFFKSTDANIDTLFNSLYLSSNEIKSCIPNDPTLAFRYKLFVEMLEEFKTRRYRKSLWKTYNEYKIFINNIADATGLPYDLVNEKFIELIQSVSGTAHCIEFEDFTQAKTKDNLNCIYVNYDNSEVPDLDKQSEFHKKFAKVFEHIGESMIIRLHLCKFKNFDNVNIKFSKRPKKYREVGDYKTPKSYIFPYIFLTEERNKENGRIETILKTLEKNFAEYLTDEITQKSIAIGSDDMGYMPLIKGKIIRDSVHGDIFVEQKYLDIINTAAFQRLHRIRQLATANMIFPEAVHTRFAHSLGTFHIMNLIMDHFCNILDALKISYSHQDKEVVLVAALLHDIGHGPFSHALEDLNNVDGFSVKKHESWTSEIIKNDTELNRVLENNFGCLFASKVIDCLENKNSNQSTLSKVFHELISSNLDADRLDYLLRDSYNTGEQIGIFDLQKLISSMELTEYNGETRVVIRDSALQYVDQYIMGRYHMYSSVYHAPFKLATEELFRRLCTIIVNYPQNYEKDGEQKKEEACKKIKDFKIYKLCFDKITEEEFLAFDDYSIINEINEGLNAIGFAENSEIYKLLSDSFMYRNNAYKRKRIGNGGMSVFNKFSKELERKFPYIDKLQSVIKLSKTFCAYKRDTEEEILIISNNGEVKPYSQVSKFKNNFTTDKRLFVSECCCYYFNRDICERELMTMAESQKDNVSKIEELFDAYDLRNHTEIENKYHCDEKTLNKIVNTLENGFSLGDYTIAVPQDFEKDQQDIYYDTDLLAMAKNKYSLRIRTIGANHVLTIKKPGNIGEKNEETQFIRLEFEKKCAENSINCTDAVNAMDENDLQAEISQKLHGFNYSDLKPVITVFNRRRTYHVMHKSSKNVLFEISLDDVEYKNISDGNTKKVYQIEIELKGSYIYRLNLDDFATEFCKEFSIETDGNKPKLSKYLEALNLFNLI